MKPFIMIFLFFEDVAFDIEKLGDSNFVDIYNFLRSLDSSFLDAYIYTFFNGYGIICPGRSCNSSTTSRQRSCSFAVIGSYKCKLAIAFSKTIARSGTLQR